MKTIFVRLSIVLFTLCGLCACGGSSTRQSESKFDDEEVKEVTSSSKSDWDSIIDEYEMFVDKYITLLKKVQAGDMSVSMEEYMSYMEKAQAIAEKLDDVRDDISSAQLNRYMKISQKMASAATEIAF